MMVSVIGPETAVAMSATGGEDNEFLNSKEINMSIFW